jgi:hypothetical protein
MPEAAPEGYYEFLGTPTGLSSPCFPIQHTADCEWLGSAETLSRTQILSWTLSIFGKLLTGWLKLNPPGRWDMNIY